MFGIEIVKATDAAEQYWIACTPATHRYERGYGEYWLIAHVDPWRGEAAVL